MPAGLTYIKNLFDSKAPNSKTWMVITEHFSYLQLRTV